MTDLNRHLTALAATARDEHSLGFARYEGIFDPELLPDAATAAERWAHAAAHEMGLLLGNNLDLSYDLEALAEQHG